MKLNTRVINKITKTKNIAKKFFKNNLHYVAFCCVSCAILLGVGGATGVNENSVAFEGESLYVASGDALYSLSLPSLELNWCVKVDFATCFGVFWLKDRNCLLTWGELEIGCYTQTGEKIWSSSGPDIFTEGLELQENIAIVTDFNGDVHNINLSNGEISSANTSQGRSN